MKRTYLPIAISMLAVCSTLNAAECEVALPGANDLPDWMAEPEAGFVWVGSPKLAAHVPENGHWTAMGSKHHYFDKWWWWREGYRALDEPEPELVITATRLDAPAPPVLMSNATNAILPRGDLMLLGMEFPAAGCWEVVGKYHGQELRFLLKVGD